MARIGKRTARRQLSKDRPTADESSGDDNESSGSDNEPQQPAHVPKDKRVMARPVSRLNRSSGSQSGENVFKGLSFPTLSSVSTTTPTDNISTSNINNSDLTAGQREAVANVKALNKSFLSAVERSLQKDDHIDLSSLFPQYSQHRQALDEKFEYCRDLSHLSRQQQQKIDLGFEEKQQQQQQKTMVAEPDKQKPFMTPEIRPVSVSVPAFAFHPPPPTPTIVQQQQQHDKNNTTIEETKKPAFTFSFGAEATKEPAVPSNISVPSPQSQPTKPAAGFSFPAVPSLPAFGSTTSSSFSSTLSASSNDKPLFSFGAPSATTTAPFSFPSTTTTTPFSFTAAPSAISINTQDNHNGNNKNSDTDEDAIPEGEEESFKGVRTNEALLQRGAGEEDEEEVLPSLRCKLFIYDSPSSAWTDLGIGFVKINKTKTKTTSSSSGKARILCRAEGSGRILLNAFLDPQVTTASWPDGKRDVQMTLFNQESRLAKYLVRAKEVDQARQLFAAVQSCLQ